MRVRNCTNRNNKNKNSEVDDNNYEEEEEDKEDNSSEASLTEGEIKPKVNYDQIVQRLSRLSSHMIHKEQRTKIELKRARPQESIIGPDGEPLPCF